MDVDSPGLDAKSIMRMLDMLDSNMADVGERASITIVGSSALMLHGVMPEGRYTQDVDLFAPAYISANILPAEMNSDFNTFAESMPEHWFERSTLVYEGECLRAYIPSVADLIAMKLYAGRGSDLNDLHAIARRQQLPFQEVEAIMADVLEFQVNLEREDWLAIKGRWDNLKEVFNVKGMLEPKRLAHMRGGEAGRGWRDRLGYRRMAGAGSEAEGLGEPRAARHHRGRDR